MKTNILSMVAAVVFAGMFLLISNESESRFVYDVNLQAAKDAIFVTRGENIRDVEEGLITRKVYPSIEKNESDYLIAWGKRAGYTSKYARTDMKMYREKANKINETMVGLNNVIKDPKSLLSNLTDDEKVLIRFDSFYFGRVMKVEK